MSLWMAGDLQHKQCQEFCCTPSLHLLLPCLLRGLPSPPCSSFVLAVAAVTFRHVYFTYSLHHRSLPFTNPTQMLAPQSEDLCPLSFPSLP